MQAPPQRQEEVGAELEEQDGGGERGERCVQDGTVKTGRAGIYLALSVVEVGCVVAIWTYASG